MGSPDSSATRRCRLSLKSISPRIADAVIAATSGLMPTMSAISSMHSIVISVESMSMATTRTRSRVRLEETNAMSIPNLAQSSATPAFGSERGSRNA